MQYVADSHAVVWALTNEKRRLGARARKVFEAADQGKALIYLSAVTLLELDWLEAAGKVRFKESFEDLVGRMSVAPGYQFVPLTMEIILLSRRFRDLDPMDRLIVATAEDLECSLITADATIQAKHPVPIVWD